MSELLLIDPGAAILLAVFVFSLWVPCLMADVIERRRANHDPNV